jgi:methyl-accepting chemotaxis protein
MKFSTNAPAVLIGAVVIVVAAVSMVSNTISHRMASSFEEGEFALMAQITQAKFREAENKAIASAEIVAASPAVKQAFAARDRDALLAATKDLFAIQKEKYGISQAQFHTAPATSFLRVHNPPHPQDDLSSYRQIVVEVNRTQAIRKGIEITTSGIGVFGTLPMTDGEGKPDGSFEMAMETGAVLDDIKRLYGFDLALLVDEKLLRETATSLKSDVFAEQNRVGNLIKFHSTHTDLLRALVAGEDTAVNEDSHYLREAGGVPYGVLIQPVYNYAGAKIGVLATAKSFAATRAADGQALVWQTLLGIVSIVLLTGVVLIVVRGLVSRPLAVIGERFEGLAGGDLDTVVEDDIVTCEELRRLAESHEALRQRLRAGDAA